ncbi:unnamed protein product [Candidula unifasciata]|uniref:Uncharacterized protein n=1 Tax=Candidula unifasciata TaxID=100452 RepID=A0A8S3Z7R8_9EUPU|nr:unnamed protein product [Candidula unifasciata]
MSEGSTAMKFLSKGESALSELVIHGKSKRTRKLKLPWITSSLPATDDVGSGEICLSMWTNNTLLYHVRHVFGGNVISVYDRDNFQKWIELSTNVTPFKSMAFNEKWIVAVCESRRICIIPNRRSDIPVETPTYTLRGEAAKMKLLGDLVIVLYADGLLETGHVVADEASQVITNWQVLIEWSDNYFCQLNESITDFAIHGQVFCAVSGKGKVFLSHFESLDQESLKRNLHSPFTVPLESEGSLITRMSLDASDGLKVALVEARAVPDKTKLHVLYLDKC